MSRKEPTFYEVVTYILEKGDTPAKELYTEKAFEKKLWKAMKSGYVHLLGENYWVLGVRGKEFFTKKHT